MRQLVLKFTRLINTAIVCSFISSFALLSYIFIGMNDISDKIIGIIFPIIFWLGLIGEQFFIWKSNSIRKSIEKSSEFRKIKSGIGVISFARTEAGLIADVVLAISFIVLLILMIFSIGENVLQYIFIFLLVLSFRLHCIFNGQNFRYKKILKKEEG